jgi:hypothetical protein
MSPDTDITVAFGILNWQTGEYEDVGVVSSLAHNNDF